MTTALIIGLSVVIVAADGETPCVLVTRRNGGLTALPFGTFDPAEHRTFEIALRGWVREQTGFDLGYVEQLYTFGDRDRETPEATLADTPENARVVSVGYLGLTPDPTRPPEALEARWRGWYGHFPWEDHRNGRPGIIDAVIAPRLQTWAAGSENRQSRARLAFGLEGQDWIDDRVLERYELLYEAGLVTECARDAGLPLPDVKLGEPMASDHRRILATAMGRLRGKIRYRPVVFELMPERFTLSALQLTCEGILGLRLHKQNFRRALDRAGLVEGTGEMMAATGGRPAELFRFCREKFRRSAALGITTPAMRREG
ncbi:MAG: NAD regulator [Henriciella sp.]|uniref:NUDIX hydrolase n=1 Tax=Henriciella sp. TaxID=1968823 RepID=UPI0032EE19A1